MEKIFIANEIIKNKIPQNYVFPPEKRPGESVFHARKAEVPIIDLHDEKNRNQHVIQSSQDLGLFQVINHGVSSELMNNSMKIFEEVFELPVKEKMMINLEQDSKYVCKLYTSSYNYETEETHYWRDALRHSCTPLQESINFWPQNPIKYREIVGPFVIGIQELGRNMLEIISQGLGLERGYLGGKFSEDHFLTINHYPKCPEPSLTLGLTGHSDPNLITILLPGQVPGLQVFKDDEWMLVETLPNAFLVIIGNQLEVISNGKLRSGFHRAVTNRRKDRTSAAYFINPSQNCIIEPANPLLQPHNDSPLFKPFKYKDFFAIYTASISGDIRTVLDCFKIKS